MDYFDDKYRLYVNQGIVVTVMMLILNNTVWKTLHEFLMIRTLDNSSRSLFCPKYEGVSKQRGC